MAFYLMLPSSQLLTQEKNYNALANHKIKTPIGCIDRGQVLLRIHITMCQGIAIPTTNLPFEV